MLAAGKLMLGKRRYLEAIASESKGYGPYKWSLSQCATMSSR